MVVGQVGAACRATCRSRMRSKNGKPCREALFARVAALAMVASVPWTAGACATAVTMDALEANSPNQPHSTILYSGVREASRRFPDYSVVDRTILRGTTP